MYINAMKNILFFVFLFSPVFGYSAKLAEALIAQGKFEAILKGPATIAYVKSAYGKNPQALILKGCTPAQLQALGIITYPPEWDAFQKELAGMDRRGLHAFLSTPHADHPVLRTFDAHGGGEPLADWLRRNLDAKFRGDETFNRDRTSKI